MTFYKLFSNTKTGKNLSEQFFDIDIASYSAKRHGGLSKIFGR
jgi:hypothetical protein